MPHKLSLADKVGLGTMTAMGAGMLLTLAPATETRDKVLDVLGPVAWCGVWASIGLKSWEDARKEQEKNRKEIVQL